MLLSWQYEQLICGSNHGTFLTNGLQRICWCCRPQETELLENKLHFQNLFGGSSCILWLWKRKMSTILPMGQLSWTESCYKGLWRYISRCFQCFILISLSVLQLLLSTLSFLHGNPYCFINLNTRKRWNDRTFQWASDQMVLPTFLPRKIRIEGDGVNSKHIKCNLPINK